ncbi:MAG: hypothetical protein JHC33_04015 [Ignisphaera sp.]|nr:hypothetical protein [Ignisphaera sp.]
MGTNSSKGNLLLVVVLAVLLGIVLVVKRKPSVPPVPPEIVIINAEQSMLTYSPTAAIMWKDISALQREDKLILTIKDGDLHGNTLGQTSINIVDNKIICNITIDTDKAKLAGDLVEPLLGHELKHVWDALFLYDKKNPVASTEAFIATVYRDKEIVHNNREVELSAIAAEDKIRSEFIESGNTVFNGMPTSRAMADIKFTTRSKYEPSLKKALLD